MKKDLINKDHWEALTDNQKAFELIRTALHNKAIVGPRPSYAYLLVFIAAQAKELEREVNHRKKLETMQMVMGIVITLATVLGTVGWLM